MPYIVTTKREGTPHSAFLDAPGPHYEAVSRRAFATLEEARRSCVGRIAKCAFDAGTTEGYQPHEDAAKALPGSGGTVGPLPDGTVIEVERVTWARVASDGGFAFQGSNPGKAEAHRRIIAAYNAKQGQR